MRNAPQPAEPAPLARAAAALLCRSPLANQTPLLSPPLPPPLPLLVDVSLRVSLERERELKS